MWFKKYFDNISKLTYSIWILILCFLGTSLFELKIFSKIFTSGKYFKEKNSTEKDSQEQKSKPLWLAPNFSSIPQTPEGELIRYGRELVAHTSVYLGPNGKKGAKTNGMNCQNCHLDAGTKPFGNNYAAVASKYPVFRSRSGTIESIEKRVNDCIERSLNGKKLNDESLEMKAFVAYLKWVGKDVKKGQKLEGLGIMKLPLMMRAADPEKGKLVYEINCASCHGINGEGIIANDGIEWIYPPLYGKKSYNTGAGLYRLSMFAGFVKANMPYGITYKNPVLTDEEAWDVAAFINSMPRPKKDLSMDWPDISQKPFDHPFGPYSDGFSEQQHKFGPFDQIVGIKKGNNLEK